MNEHIVDDAMGGYSCTHTIFLCSGSKVIASLRVFDTGSIYGKIAAIDNFHVRDSKMINKGFGSKLMRYTINMLREKGFDSVRLIAGHDLRYSEVQRARHVYSKFGFISEGKFDMRCDLRSNT